MCEQSPIVAALLDDALQRAAQDTEIGNWVTARMKLTFSDSLAALRQLPKESLPDVIYIDPMYPRSKRSAKVKKEIRALQQLLGPDQNSVELFNCSLRSAHKRVVVKRPRWADPLHARNPNTSVQSKNTRYDIYFTLAGSENS